MDEQKTAYIHVKANKTDPVYQNILVRDGEYYHPQFSRWFTLPQEWVELAHQALYPETREVGSDV